MAEFKRGQQKYKQETKPLIAPDLVVTQEQETIPVVSPEPKEKPYKESAEVLVAPAAEVEAVEENPTVAAAEELSLAESQPLSVLDAEEMAPESLSDSLIDPPLSTEPSPAEERIREMMDEPENGWNHIESASRNGMPVRLSRVPSGEGILGYWKRTRAFHAKRWQETGCWCDFITHAQFTFEPLFWRPRFD